MRTFIQSGPRRSSARPAATSLSSDRGQWGTRNARPVATSARSDKQRSNSRVPRLTGTESPAAVLPPVRRIDAEAILNDKQET